MSVALVGAGPGGADLLTLRGAALLAEADVVVVDRLVDESVLALVNPAAQIIDVGKTPGQSSSQAFTNALLVSLGQTGKAVVRLKGGDPFVFGRGGEEVATLEAAGIAVEVVPGVTSAFAAPAAAGIAVTHRDLARGVVVVTATASDGTPTDLSGLATLGLTIVVLMGVRHRGLVADQLLRGGAPGSTPVAAVHAAWTDSQTVRVTTLDRLAALEVANPAVLVIGAVAAMAGGVAAVLEGAVA